MIKKKFIPRPKESEETIEKRWTKKKEQIEILANNIRKLRYNVSTDLKSDNEKIALTALVVAIMDKTAERVGNIDSAGEGHYGVTCFRKKHIKIEGNKITFEYVGKSGVEHEKSFSDERIAECLRQAFKNSKSRFIFTTSDGFKIQADRVNRYLSDFGIRSKDIRGYSANTMMISKLKANDEIEDDEKKRKKYFMKSLREVARKIGHGSGTLRKQYLIPQLEISYIINGDVIDISDRDNYETGGTIVLNTKSRKETFIKEKGGVVGDEYSAKQIEDITGKKFKWWWYEDIIVHDGVRYKKCFQRSYYKIIN